MTTRKGSTAEDEATGASGVGEPETVTDRERLLLLPDDMKVWQLAELAGTSVDAVVAKVVQGAEGQRRSGTGGSSQTPRRSRRSMMALASEGEVEPQPELGRLLGRATRQELDLVVDRWVLSRVLAACGGNISHAAKRLELSRRTLREHWAAVRRAELGALVAKLASSGIASDVPAGPSLAELLEQGATYRELHREVDRWVVEHTLANEDGNVTRSAKSLGISRRLLREIRDSNATGSGAKQGKRVTARASHRIGLATTGLVGSSTPCCRGEKT